MLANSFMRNVTHSWLVIPVSSCYMAMCTPTDILIYTYSALVPFATIHQFYISLTL